MTVILSAVLGDYAFHVSDRLVTTQHGRRYIPFDKQANKTIVFRAKDAIVAIGYSGVAFIDGLPTDTWIANSLLGHKNREYVAISMLSSNSFIFSGISQTLYRLKTDYEDAYKHFNHAERKAAPQFFNIVGRMHDRRRGHERPIYCEMVSDRKNPGRLVTTFGKRAWDWHRKAILLSSPNIGVKEFEIAFEKIKTHGLRSPDEFEKMLVETVRRISNTTQTVGWVCTCVRISQCSMPQVVIRHADPLTERKVFPAASGKSHVPEVEAYMPYVISPPDVWAPSYIYGGDAYTQTFDNGYKFSFKLQELKRDKPPTQFARGTQIRPQDPLRRGK